MVVSLLASVDMTKIIPCRRESPATHHNSTPSQVETLNYHCEAKNLHLLLPKARGHFNEVPLVQL